MPIRNAPVLLIGTIAQRPTNVYAYVDNKRTDQVRAKRVAVVCTQVPGGFGVTEVNVPLEILDQFNLGEQATFAGWVQFGAYGGGDRDASSTCSAVAAADENAAQLVFESVNHMRGVADAGKRAAA